MRMFFLKISTFIVTLSILREAGIFTNDLRKAFEAYETLEVGGVIINDIPTFRIDHMPYGGVKQSGVGREGVRYAIEEMTELKLMALNLK
jgi:glyceraldehyde-3-phosphate dehydrogenase (NADP+)